MRLGEDQAEGGAPVVADELDPLDLDLIKEADQEARQAGERVVKMTALAAAAEAEQVRRQPARPLE